MTKSPTNDADMPMSHDLRERAFMIDDLGGMLASGDTTLEVVPSMFKRVMAGDAWLHFKTKFGNEVSYERTPEDFKRFVETAPLDGLGTTLPHLRQLIAHDVQALAIFEELTQQPVGTNQYAEGVNVINTLSRPQGDSTERALRVLRERHPDLYMRVLNKEIKPHAAMVEAGEASPKTTIRLDDVDSIARTLRKHLDATQLHALLDLLGKDGDA